MGQTEPSHPSVANRHPDKRAHRLNVLDCRLQRAVGRQKTRFLLRELLPQTQVNDF